MYQINFKDPIHIYFMGIGGISMSGLAEILLEQGFTVSGSDLKESELTIALAEKGATIFYGQTAENLNPQCGLAEIDLVVYTAAIKDDNPEFIALKEKGINSMTRAELLGQIMKNYQVPIAIAGTHGKTTTTGMVSEILLKARLDPTLSIGGILNSIDGNIKIGKSDFFVTEACEYTNSFLQFYPKIGVILNIEADHLDFFKNEEEIRQSFRKFAELIPADGVLIINGAIKNLSEVVNGLSCQVIVYGEDPANDYYISDVTYDKEAHPTFTLNYHPQSFADVKAAAISHASETYTLGTRGMHNALNAAASIALSDYLNIDTRFTKDALMAFTGTKRRFEEKGQCAGFMIIDDYAHHPTEIKATLETARNYPHRLIWCVFQPHTYTRTKAFMNEFADSLCGADRIILIDIYAAREKNEDGISSKDLVNIIKKSGKECYYISTLDSFANAEKFILENVEQGDLLITMGAGDVVTIGDNLLKN
ncbi:MAG: UDP-N-acetylmuramate--L-alanine ligase [Lachnospiraceae bacterium]|nr:UDP-N-acetylmuramate--L-alanine ligase [Lachnospiraceae bacterium]